MEFYADDPYYLDDMPYGFYGQLDDLFYLDERPYDLYGSPADPFCLDDMHLGLCDSPDDPLGLYDFSHTVREAEEPNRSGRRPHLGDSGPTVFDLSSVSFPIPKLITDRSSLMTKTKKAVQALFSPTEASTALEHLLQVAYSLTLESSTVGVRAKQILKDEEASRKAYKPAELNGKVNSYDSKHYGPVLDDLTDENLSRYVLAIINTISLLRKMDTSSFNGYVRNNLKSAARKNKVPALVHLFPESATLRLASAISGDSGVRKQIYLLYLVQLSVPSTMKSAEIFGASRLTGYGLTLPSLFVQTCDLLGWQPSKLLKAIKGYPSSSIEEGKNKVKGFLKAVNGKETVVGKYSVLLASLIDSSYFSGLGVKGNSDMMGVLKAMNVRAGNRNVCRIKGVHATKRVREFSAELAKKVVADAKESKGEKKKITWLTSFDL